MTSLSRQASKSDPPPLVCNEPASGYLYFSELDIYVLVEEFSIIFDVAQEINQIQFAGKRHGTRHLKNLGCKGPLCKKAQRDYVRTSDSSTSESYGRRRWARYDELLEMLQLLHERQLNQLAQAS